MIPKAYNHQSEMTDFIRRTLKCFVTSDPGTGKTRAVLDAIITLGGATLVLAPLSILQPAWGNDTEQFTPDQTYSCSYARKRAETFALPVDITITNHDAVKWVAKQLKEDPHFLDRFDTLIIDECTAFKNRTTQRSTALREISSHFERIVELTGTLNSNGVLDTWHPTFILDDGHRLGKNFFQFRSSMCSPVQVGPRPEMREWREKPEATGIVASLIADINIRHKFEDCIDIPENAVRTVYTTLPKTIMDQYHELKDESILFTDQHGGIVNAIHAGVRVKKLLQLVTGAIYDEHGDVHKIHTERYELVMDLVEARDHSLVAFNWKHERNELCYIASKRKLRYAVIDGDVTSNARRTEIVRAFQAGELDVLFCHPQSAAHGLTLTRARTTIWCSPTYNAEHFQQFNRRIYRATQTAKTETILVTAVGTWEEEVYARLNTKLSRMDELLGILSTLTLYKEAS